MTSIASSVTKTRATGPRPPPCSDYWPSAALNFLGLLPGIIDIEAEYLSGCDGANSMVRRAVDIKISVRTLAHIANLRRKPAIFFANVNRQRLWSNVRIIDLLGTNVWTRRSEVADRYSKGRIFLASDLKPLRPLTNTIHASALGI